MKALACSLPAETGRPLSRWSCAEPRREVIKRGIVVDISGAISGATIWRWLSEDAIRPWTRRSWLFSRDPDFERKAARLLDLYHREWEGRPLGKGDFVLSADEKTQLQIRERIHPPAPPAPGTGPFRRSTPLGLGQLRTDPIPARTRGRGKGGRFRHRFTSGLGSLG